MSTTAPTEPSTVDARRRRRVLWALLLALLLLLTSCTAYSMGRTSTTTSDDAARPAPTVTVEASATPAPTVTVQVPGPSGSGGDGSGDGTGTGDGTGGVVTGGVGGSGSGSVGGGAALPFRLSATLLGEPLQPGEPGDLRVVVTNPNKTALTVRSIDVTVKTPKPPTCLPSWFTVGNYDATTDPVLRVTPSGSAVVLIPLTLVNLPTTNQNACQGATIPLSLTGTGRLG